MGERLSNFVVRHRSLTSLSLPLAKFKVPSSGWRRGLISIARLEGMVRGRERVVTLGRKGRGRRITFYDSPLFRLAPFPTLPSTSELVYTSLRGRYATSRHPPTPWAADPRTQSLFHPFFAAAAAGKRRPEVVEGWGGRCHCTALGEGHYSEQGEPVTSAPTPGIDPYPPPPPVCRVWHGGVQCTVRFSTFIIRCARAPAEGTRRCYPSWKGWYRVNRWSTIFSIRFDRSGCSKIVEILNLLLK